MFNKPTFLLSLVAIFHSADAVATDGFKNSYKGTYIHTAYLDDLDSTTCSQPFPGYSLFSSGWDLTKFDVLNALDLGSLKTVLVTTCDQSQTTYNGYLDQTFQQPDQIDSIVDVGGTIESQDGFVVANSQQARINIGLTISTSYFWGLFSSSKSYYAMAQALASEYVYYGERHVSMSAYKISTTEEYMPQMNLTDEVLYLVVRLPSEFNETTMPQYQNIIDIFGHAFLNEAVIGCKMSYQHLTGAGKLDVMAESDVELNAGFDFLGILAKTGAIHGTVTAASETYVNATKSTITCYGGGQGCPTDPTSYGTWLSDCPRTPTIISASFKPISTLFPDQDLATEFDKAVVNHFNRAFLQNELIPLCDVILDLVKTSFVFDDSGGDCDIPEFCPPNTVFKCSLCDGSEYPVNPDPNCPTPSWTPGLTCPNPVFGSTAAEINQTSAIVQQNMTTWASGIQGIVDQANLALELNIVPNVTVAAIGLEFYEYVKNIQTAFTTVECGWTFNQYKAGFLSVCARGPATQFVQRTIRYIQGLYGPF